MRAGIGHSPLWLVPCLLLAGCSAAPAADTSPEGPSAQPDAPLGVLLSDLTSEACRYNDLVFLVPYAHAQAALPKGWTARMQGPETGAMVINLLDCKEGFGWSGADLFVMLDAPEGLPSHVHAFDAANRTPRDAEKHFSLDLYMLAAHTDHAGLRAIFERANMTVADGRVTKDALPSPVGSAARGTLEDANGTIITYAVSGAPIASAIAHHRQWRETPEGLVLVERVWSNKGAPVDLTVGTSACTIRADDIFARLIGRAECSPSLGQDIPGGVGWEGAAYVFPSVTLGAAS